MLLTLFIPISFNIYYLQTIDGDRWHSYTTVEERHEQIQGRKFRKASATEVLDTPYTQCLP